MTNHFSLENSKEDAKLQEDSEKKREGKRGEFACAAKKKKKKEKEGGGQRLTKRIPNAKNHLVAFGKESFPLEEGRNSIHCPEGEDEAVEESGRRNLEESTLRFFRGKRRGVSRFKRECGVKS